MSKENEIERRFICEANVKTITKAIKEGMKMAEKKEREIIFDDPELEAKVNELFDALENGTPRNTEKITLEELDKIFSK